MSRKDERNRKNEPDDMNIRANLNDSLDMDDIRISEDLIHRTLTAIKEQQDITNEEKYKAAGEASGDIANGKAAGGSTGQYSTMQRNAMQRNAVQGSRIARRNRLIRSFATVAAALVIVAAGYAVTRQLPAGMKKEANSGAAPESSLYATSKDDSTSQKLEGSATTDTAGTAAEDNKAAQEGEADEELAAYDSKSTGDQADTGSDPSVSSAQGTDETGIADSQFTISAGTYGTARGQEGEGEDDSEGSGETPADTDGAVEKPKANMAFSKLEATLTFRDIFLPDPAQAEYIKITDDVNNTSVNLTSSADISAFYAVMDLHSFTAADADNTADDAYTVEMLDPDTQALYTMRIGGSLTVRFAQGGTELENTYTALDDALFKEDLQKFYAEHAK